MAAFQITLPALSAMAVLLLVQGVDIDVGKVNQELGASCRDGVCNDKSGQESQILSSSLLQKVFKRQPKTILKEGKANALLSEDHLEALRRPSPVSFANTDVGSSEMLQGPCEGTQAQDKCWHLSDLGESCSDTCAKYGESFSFVVADNLKPITPSLLGASPHIRQQPWASLECYVKGEDRYHTANVNAAKHFVGDIGSWSHSQCQLACPCGHGPSSESECTWKQPPACAPVFVWNGVIHTGCTTVGHDAPWCMHHFQHTGEEVMSEAHWSYCERVCAPDSKRDSDEKPDGKCEWRLGNGCSREFDYEGTRYVGCTSADHASPWCSMTDKYAGSWTHCVYSCPYESEIVEEIMQSVMADDEMCSWHSQPKCSNSTVYKGVTYTGCIDIDHPTPWCSHDSVHDGSFSLCRRSCNQATLAAPAEKVEPEPAPADQPIPVPKETPRSAPADQPIPEPCTRRDIDNDVVGNYVSLDEVGYKTLAQVESLTNMKRFICRVAEHIQCKVIDNSSLMAFVPTYSSVASHQDYAHLESELTALCHAGDKWLVPSWYA